MNLVIIAALVAACGAAKLDRTYLPPASAKTAGGTSDSLQTPFSRSSTNQGVEGPSGSYTNDFQGVVVDAANPATRVSSGSEQTGLGAPRVSYGSTSSKVGDAAFRDSIAGFRQIPTQPEFNSNDGQTSGTQVAPEFNQESFVAPEFNQESFVARPERPQASLDRSANIIRHDSDVGAETYSFGYETDNGISASENGVAVNGVQAQGGFSYKGDDGQIYSITYTADEGGYRPVGNHLPTPPPIPEEILKSLEQNAKEEAAGIVDDGTYDAQKYNDGGDYPESHNDRQSSQFGDRPESATGSAFINQNQGFGKPTFNTGFSVLGSNANRPLSNTFGSIESSGQSENGFGFNQNQQFANAFNQGSEISSQGQDTSDAGISGQFGQSAHASAQIGPFGQSETTAQSPSGSQLSQTPSFGNQDSTGSQFNSQQSSLGSRPQFGVQSSRPQFGQNQIPISGSAQASSSISGSPAPAFGYQYGGQQGSGSQFGAQPSSLQFGQNQIPAVGSALTSGSSAQNYRPQFSSQAQLFKPEGTASDSNSASSFNLGQNTQASGNFQQLSEGRPQGFASQTTFNRPSSSFSGQGSFNAANAFGLSPNTASAINKQSNQETGLVNNNEYLPPLNSNGRPTQGFQPQKPDTTATFSFNQFTGNMQTSNNFPTLSSQDRPQGFQPSTSSLASGGSQPAFNAQSAQFNGFQQTQSPNNIRPSQFTQNTNNLPSTQDQNQYTSNSNSPQYNGNAQPIQSTSTFTASSQLATSQPEIELTTPLEPNESLPSADKSQPSESSASSFASFGTQPSNIRPGKPQFGVSFQNGQNPSPFATQATATAFSSSSPTSQPQGQKPFRRPNVQSQSPFPTQASFNPSIKFGDRIPQNTFSQKIGDAQYASSTQKPVISQTLQLQGGDDSYYYNQPSKPFSTPTNRPFGSKIPSAPKTQFNNVNSQSSFGQNSFSNNRQPNFPASSLPSGIEQLQGQSGKPSVPTIASIAPTSATQKETGTPQSYYNGVTQASISPFAGAPTPSTQFGSQQSSQFGSRPQSPSTQFNQPQTQSQAGINQPSATQQTFPQRPTNQFGQKPTSFQSQNQSQFGQASVSKNESPEDNASQSVPSQQYSGEVYQYNKPAEVLPAPEQTDSTSSQNVQSNIETDSTDNKSQQPEGSKPAFGTSPQDQNPQPTQGSQAAQEPQGSRPQFGAQPFRPFGTQTQESIQGSKPQFNSPLRKPCCQGNKLGQTAQPTQDTNQFGRPIQGTQASGQFNMQATGFQSSQTFKPDQVSQGFERGEIFGGPRNPPRFDDKTGYHY